MGIARGLFNRRLKLAFLKLAKSREVSFVKRKRRVFHRVRKSASAQHLFELGSRDRREKSPPELRVHCFGANDGACKCEDECERCDGSKDSILHIETREVGGRGAQSCMMQPQSASVRKLLRKRSDFQPKIAIKHTNALRAVRGLRILETWPEGAPRRWRLEALQPNGESDESVLVVCERCRFVRERES